jgi:hypothetical protein
MFFRRTQMPVGPHMNDPTKDPLYQQNHNIYMIALGGSQLLPCLFPPNQPEPTLARVFPVFVIRVIARGRRAFR